MLIWPGLEFTIGTKKERDRLSDDFNSTVDRIFDTLEKKENTRIWEDCTVGPRTRVALHDYLRDEKDYNNVKGSLPHLAGMLEEAEFYISVMQQDLDYAYLGKEIDENDYMTLGKRIQKMNKQTSKMKKYLGKDDVVLENENV